MKEYTQSGYLSAAKSFDPADLEADCSGKEFMITGSNSGIGKVAALEIAKRGGSVHMICRFVVLNRASMAVRFQAGGSQAAKYKGGLW